MPSSWITKSKRCALYERDGYTCCYCGCVVVAGAHGRDTGAAATLDHLRPQALGGSNAAENLATACWTCNSSRQDAPLAAFVRRVAARLGVESSIVAKRVRNARNRSWKRAAESAL